MKRLRLKERQAPRHCISVFKNNNGTKYISNQILCEICWALRTVSFLAGLTVNFLERGLPHINPVASECQEIKMSEENLLGSNLHPINPQFLCNVITVFSTGKVHRSLPLHSIHSFIKEDKGFMPFINHLPFPILSLQLGYSNLPALFVENYSDTLDALLEPMSVYCRKPWLVQKFANENLLSTNILTHRELSRT